MMKRLKPTDKQIRKIIKGQEQLAEMIDEKIAEENMMMKRGKRWTSGNGILFYRTLTDTCINICFWKASWNDYVKKYTNGGIEIGRV